MPKDITSEVLEYKSATQNTAHFELHQSEVEDDLNRFLRSALSQQDYNHYLNYAEAVERNKEAITAARKWEKVKREELVAAAECAAQEDNLRGRVLHPNINIAETTDVIFHNRGQAALWLSSVGREEDVVLKVWKLDWFRDHATNGTLPAFIELCNRALIRIDSVWD